MNEEKKASLGPQETPGWQRVSETLPDLMVLPEDTRVEIIRREKKNSFMIGNPVPFEVMLDKILKKTGFSAEDFAETVGVPTDLIELLLEQLDYANHPYYPYNLLIQKYKRDLLWLMQAIGFSVQDWELTPDRSHYYDPSVAIFIEEEDHRRTDDDDEEENQEEPGRREFLSILKNNESMVSYTSRNVNMLDVLE